MFDHLQKTKYIRPTFVSHSRPTTLLNDTNMNQSCYISWINEELLAEFID